MGQTSPGIKKECVWMNKSLYWPRGLTNILSNALYMKNNESGLKRLVIIEIDWKM